MMPNLDKPIVQWALLLFLAFIWGSSFILMKKALISFSHDQIASLRILISFLFLSPIIFKNLKKIQKNDWWKVILAGLLGSGIPAFLFPLAQTHINSSLAGMLNSLVPVFTVIIGLLFFKMTFRWLKTIGVVVGLIGAIGLLASKGSLNLEANDLPYALLVILATLCYAININFIKNFLKGISSLNITSFGFLLIGPLAGTYLFSTDFTTVVQTEAEAPLHLFYIALLSIVGTAIAVILFNMLIKRVSAVLSSSVTYIIPVFAIMWGLIDGEQIALLQFLFIGTILIGVYIVNKDNRLERIAGIKEVEKKVDEQDR